MIHDLDKTLVELLNRALPPELVEQVDISFAAPDNQFPPASVSLPAIDLFLYDIRENHDLRSNQWELEREGGQVVRRRPPVRVDCSYLVTAWASEGSTTPAQDEHRLLGEVMNVLLRYPTLPRQILQGALVESTPAMPTTTLQPGRLQSLGEFWQALGGKPKAALNYQVTLALEPQGAEELGPPVTDKLLGVEVPEA